MWKKEILTYFQAGAAIPAFSCKNEDHYEESQTERSPDRNFNSRSPKMRKSSAASLTHSLLQMCSKTGSICNGHIGLAAK
jgi:hypothetical protein